MLQCNSAVIHVAILIVQCKLLESAMILRFMLAMYVASEFFLTINGLCRVSFRLIHGYILTLNLQSLM